MKVSKTTSIGLAIAAAGLFATAPMAAETGGNEAQVHCYGVNACKGQNDCKTAENACKGKAVCKGHGFSVMTDKECADKGGTVGE